MNCFLLGLVESPTPSPGGLDHRSPAATRVQRTSLKPDGWDLGPLLRYLSPRLPRHPLHSFPKKSSSSPASAFPEVGAGSGGAGCRKWWAQLWSGRLGRPGSFLNDWAHLEETCFSHL